MTELKNLKEGKRKREASGQRKVVEDLLMNSFKIPFFRSPSPSPSSSPSPSLSPSASTSPSRSSSHSKPTRWPPEEWFRPTTATPAYPQNPQELDPQPKLHDHTRNLSLPQSVTKHQPLLFSSIIQSSPSNTQSINPNQNSTTAGQTITTLNSTNQDITSSSSPQSIHLDPTPIHQPFRPPPLHPSILAHKNGGMIDVKETMDAQSSFSERGHKQVNQYLIKTEIGRGSFGAVHLAEDAETGLSYAIKEFSKTRMKRKFARELKYLNQSFDRTNDGLFLIRNEVAIMKKIKHQNVVKLHEVLDVVDEDSLYMVMEYCPGGSLMQLVKEAYQENQNGFQSGLEIDVVRKYFRQLIVGIDYLHRNEIIHYDIKPDNILLSSDKKQIKVADFGISAMFTRPGDDSSVTRTVGSPAFLSPELLKSKPDAAVSGTTADIWAMGVTLYFILTGRLPFPSSQLIEMCDAVENQAPPIPNEWDATLIDLMSKLFDKDPHSRIKMSELKVHPWVTHSGKLRGLSSSEESNPSNITDHDLKHCFRFGITNHCPLTKSLFFEFVENSRKHCWKSAGNHRGRRREMFFKEFHRQISERNKV